MVNALVCCVVNEAGLDNDKGWGMKQDEGSENRIVFVVMLVIVYIAYSFGLNSMVCSFLISDANTASGGEVESIQLALMEITKWPPFFRKYWALRPTIRA